MKKTVETMKQLAIRQVKEHPHARLELIDGYFDRRGLSNRVRKFLLAYQHPEDKDAPLFSEQEAGEQADRIAGIKNVVEVKAEELKSNARENSKRSGSPSASRFAKTSGVGAEPAAS